MNVGRAFVLLLSLIALARATILDEVAVGLNKYQTSDGAFRSGDEADLEATANGVFLASLFSSPVNLEATKTYVSSLQNGDSGFSNKNGLSSDVESTRNALQIFSQLKALPSNTASIASFVRSLRDESGLFASRAGGKPSLEATAQAVQALQFLGDAGKTAIKDNSAKLNAILKKSYVNDDFNFAAESALAPISADYYATVIALATGFDISSNSAEKFAKHIADSLNKLPKTAANAEIFAHGVHAISLLSGVTKTDLVEQLGEELDKVATDLNSAAYTLQALSLTDEFDDFFNEQILWETSDGSRVGDRIIQGVDVKPGVTILTPGGASHPGFTVQATVALPGGAPKTETLKWNDLLKAYTSSEYLKTANLLGTASFSFSAHLNLAGLGQRSLTHKEDKSIGYGIAVEALASMDGRPISEGGLVSVGTEFRFGVTLHNAAAADISAGDFSVTFSVLDASHVTVYTETLPRRGASGLIRFAYTLKSANIPAGELLFRFAVSSGSSAEPHTITSVSYRVNTPLAAANIKLGKNEYKLGETLHASMDPAVSSVMRSFVLLDVKDATGKPTLDARTFFLDIKSAGGVSVASVVGKGAVGDANKLRYTFDYSLEPTFDNVGTLVLSFRFVGANGESVTLNNYDSANNELYDDAHVLSVSVPVSLQYISEGTRPGSDAFFYGNEIVYSFKIKDTVSGKLLQRGKVEGANAFLYLRATEAGKAVGSSSVRVPAQQTASGFIIRWTINPNAMRGAGQIAVVAEDADGNKVPLAEDGKKEIQQNVVIGGEIQVTPSTVSQTVTDRHNQPRTHFVVSFSLTCRGKELKDAQLKAIVDLVAAGNTTAVATLPVATNGGSYSVSWSTKDKAPSGQYKIKFYREDERIKPDSQPIFEIAVDHDSGSSTRLPVRTEFLAVVLLTGIYIALYQRRRSYEEVKNK